MAQSSSNNDSPPALRVVPQPACVFDAARGPEMVMIEGGEFVMGSPDTENGRHAHEWPQHRVKVQSFALGRCEVTMAEFEQFVAETGYRTAAEDAGCYTLNSRGDGFGLNTNANWRKPGMEQRASHPVGCVTFGDAQKYIAWLSSRMGQAYRLPTEAEWEYAARAGSTGRFSFGDDVDATVQCEYANGADQSIRTQPFAKASEVAKCDDQQVFTAPTASFKPNALGLYDMHGNVVEGLRTVITRATTAHRLMGGLGWSKTQSIVVVVLCAGVPGTTGLRICAPQPAAGSPLLLPPAALASVWPGLFDRVTAATQQLMDQPLRSDLYSPAS